MNQKTLQSIYKTFETEEFYRRYLVELGCREDRRKAEDQRAIRVTAKDNSVVLSCGQTIIIAHVESAIEQVTFSPVSNSYGEPLLKVKVSNTNGHQRSRQNKGDRAIQHYIQERIEWGYIEDQLAGSDLLSGKQYAHKGSIIVRVLGDDGGVEEFSLLAVELLLLTCKFKKFVVHKQKIDLKKDYSLNIKSVVYPIKYSEILDRILIDPSQSQTQSADLLVTVLTDLRNFSNPPTVMQQVRKIKEKDLQTRLLGVMKRWQIDISNIKHNFQQKIQELRANNECVLNML